MSLSNDRFRCRCFRLLIIYSFSLSFLLGILPRGYANPVISSGISSDISSNRSQGAPVMTIKPVISVTQGEHCVQKGETLYSIAWHYNRDFREIAKINNIAEPYYLKIGQLLKLDKNLNPESENKINENTLKLTKLTKLTNLTLPKGEIQHSTQTKIWHWPTSGKIIKGYSNELNKAFNKGIDIAGQLGAPIMAAMPGKVVYCGNGLRGLGQLLIIKHDDHFLSAYANNQELMVKEGQYVNQGQVIAKMGNRGSEIAKLHFEIRYKGHAVNPLNFLPKQTTLAFH